jgi:hypothetical protein
VRHGVVGLTALVMIFAKGSGGAIGHQPTKQFGATVAARHMTEMPVASCNHK